MAAPLYRPEEATVETELMEEHHERFQHSVHRRLRANSTIMQFQKILVANRGEIPIRIFRTAHELSLQTVAVYSHEDRLSMHRQKADEAYMIGRRGQYTPVGAYLAGDEIIKIAVEHGVHMIHPGYGFLSENAEFARNVEKAGIIFVGPSPDTIDDLGDKVSARRLAIQSKVPIVPGTEGPVERYEQVKEFTDTYGFPIIIKAAFGGGGRGMRVVRDPAELRGSFERATSEARTALATEPSSSSASSTVPSTLRFSFWVITRAMLSTSLSVTAPSSVVIRRSLSWLRPRICLPMCATRS